MSYPTHLHNIRSRNGRFARKPVPQVTAPVPEPPPEPEPPRKRRKRQANPFFGCSDRELLGLTPRKFKPLAELLCTSPGERGYTQHRKLLCTYLHAARRLEHLEQHMQDTLARRDRYYGVGKVMHTLRVKKLLDLYGICVLNGIEVPFGSSRTQMLEWLEAHCRVSGLLLEAQEPSEGEAGLEDGGEGDNAPEGSGAATNATSRRVALAGEGA